MNILIFVGAGASIELGVPAMHGMAAQFLDHCEQWNIEYPLVKEILSKNMDIEDLIETIDKISTAGDSLQYISADQQKLELIDKVRSEVEWFVQHAAERINPIDANILWGSALNKLKDHNTSIATTNYDRAIELSANYQRIKLDDGFLDFGASEKSDWDGFGVKNTGIPLIKLHGSTDWYLEENGNKPIKLRHPMPLFGRSKIQIRNGIVLGSALVLPSREKLLNKEPYPRNMQKFLNVADSCDLALFIGTSLRDPHIKSTAESIAKRVPLFVVTPEKEVTVVTSFYHVQQHASTFLISTLPSAFLMDDPIEYLKAKNEPIPETNNGIFKQAQIIFNSDSDSNMLCKAIEFFDKRELILEPTMIEKLISHDDLMVAKYALSLIAISPKKEEMISVAEKSKHSNNEAFKQDFDLLKKIVEKANKKPRPN